MELAELWRSRGLSPDVFAARYGDAFLLLHGSANDLHPTEGPEKTGIIEVAQTRGPLVPALDFIAFPVRNSGRSLFGSKISVGRTQNNDIQIDDRTVSKLHAIIEREAAGEFRIRDAGSAAGTLVEGQVAPARGDGEGVPLRAGVNIILGGVQLTFLDLAAMLSLLAGIRDDGG